MSTRAKQNVKCLCERKFEVDLWDSVNVTKNPELKKVLLNGELNVVVCPSCGLLFYAEKFLIYHDEKKKYLFYIYCHDCQDDRPMLLKKLNADYELLRQKSGGAFLSDYKMDIFIGLDELVQFLHEDEEYDEDM